MTAAANVIPLTKRCSRCVRTKALPEFRMVKDPRVNGGTRPDSWCLDCRREVQRVGRRATGGRLQIEDEPGMMTQVEIGIALGISRGRVHQLEQSALRKLRKGLERLLRNEARALGAREVVELIFR